MLDGLIPRNVCDAVKAPQNHRPEVTPFSPTQVKALLEAVTSERLGCLFVLAIHTGLRRGELLALRWSDVDLDAGKLTVQRSLAADGTFTPRSARAAGVQSDSLRRLLRPLESIVRVSLRRARLAVVWCSPTGLATSWTATISITGIGDGS